MSTLWVLAFITENVFAFIPVTIIYRSLRISDLKPLGQVITETAKKISTPVSLKKKMSLVRNLNLLASFLEHNISMLISPSFASYYIAFSSITSAR